MFRTLGQRFGELPHAILDALVVDDHSSDSTGGLARQTTFVHESNLVTTAVRKPATGN
jgi:hypothetical protein